jgi:lysophospholipase L1-like esterase
LWYENVLNTEKFLGWPINPKIGGYFINRKLDQSLKVSELDGHPNKAGQIKIMELLYDWLGPRVSS